MSHNDFVYHTQKSIETSISHIKLLSYTIFRFWCWSYQETYITFLFPFKLFLKNISLLSKMILVLTFLFICKLFIVVYCLSIAFNFQSIYFRLMHICCYLRIIIFLLYSLQNNFCQEPTNLISTHCGIDCDVSLIGLNLGVSLLEATQFSICSWSLGTNICTKNKCSIIYYNINK